MKLVQRIKALWRLSEMQVIASDNKVEFKDLLEMAHSLPKTKKMAVIIKKTTPSEEFLKENPNE